MSGESKAAHWQNFIITAMFAVMMAGGGAAYNDLRTWLKSNDNNIAKNSRQLAVIEGRIGSEFDISRRDWQAVHERLRYLERKQR